ncbi:hypothetical protein L6452_33075 [Arctium lappa]|uniref:Uncharacterized protein n=1 Tax=Arctium lappa TaxID=4217 RepID=A0ACB8Z7A3_ARCLA|nr:hypothetical protein L6452_33075 [Arctium lappa]
MSLGDINSLAPGIGNAKLPEANTKNVKAHRKPPQSFITVVELLLESVITYVPASEDKTVAGEGSSVTDMEIDVASSKGKGKAIVSASEEKEDSGQESSVSLVKVVFILKLLKEILLISHVPPPKGPTSIGAGGIFHHILCKFLPHLRSSKREKKTDGDWRHKLAGRASQFLVASCVRSTEARRRIFIEINNAYIDFVDNCKVHRPPGNDIQAFVDLLGDVLAPRSPTGSSISGEASVTFIDVGLVRSLTRTLHMLDLDHAESLKIVPGLVKVLELVTKEHVHAAEGTTTRAENPTKPPDHSQRGGTNSADDMEHDQDIDGGFAPPSEDDYMHETYEDARGLENGLGSETKLMKMRMERMKDTMIWKKMKCITCPHPDTDQDDHEIEDEFDEDMIEEEDEDDEDDDGGVILRLGEGMNGINVLDHIEVFGRDHSFSNDSLHVMPVEVFGSRRQGRTTSIYNLLGRSGDSSVPS